MANLQEQYAALADEIEAAVKDVLESCRFILGPNVSDLESEIAGYSEAAHAVGVASGTDAIMLALAACGVGPGDEVITTPFTFVATTEVIAQLGARPVYADIDLATFNLDPKDVEARITPKTRAILPVHLYGQVADVVAFQNIADKHGLSLIYDGAQAIGAGFEGKKVGQFGDAVTLSFFPTKNLGGAGDGGMVLTNDEAVAAKVKSLRFHGSGGGYFYNDVGWCSRLDEIQAAILRVKLKHLDEWNARRTANAQGYNSLLSDTGLILPSAAPGNDHVWHQYTVLTDKRDELKDYLKSREIDSAVYYPGALHLQPAYSGYGYSEGDFPNVETACRQVLSLPVFPELPEGAVQKVSEAIRDFLKG